MSKITLINITILVTVLESMITVGYADNCPDGTNDCYKKAIFVRDIGEADADWLERHQDGRFNLNHHDCGMYIANAGEVTAVRAVGLGAVSNSEAKREAIRWMRSYFSPFVGWVDGVVASAGVANVGPPGSENDVTSDAYFYFAINYSSYLGPKPNCYHLALYNCRHYADDLYSGEEVP